MGTVSEAPSWGCLLAISGPYTERIFTVGFSGGLIGRSRKCAISLLHDCEVSHNHAVIELINGVLCIRDVGSTFGTYLNDKRLSEPKRASDAYKLKPCDSIKVGQTSLRWRPIGDIRRALMVCVPQPCGFPHDVLLRLPPATLSSDDQGHLLSTLTALYVQHMEVLPHPAPPQTHTAPACEGPAAPRNGASRPLTSPWQGFATLCRTATPVDLPQLERRLQQLDHVQRQTVRHATDSLQTVSVDAMANLGAAAAAVSGNPAQTFSLSEAAQGEGPRLVRLGELVREGLTLRAECWALMLEQHERLTQFIGAVQAPPHTPRPSPHAQAPRHACLPREHNTQRLTRVAGAVCRRAGSTYATRSCGRYCSASARAPPPRARMAPCWRRCSASSTAGSRSPRRRWSSRSTRRSATPASLTSTLTPPPPTHPEPTPSPPLPLTQAHHAAAWLLGVSARLRAPRTLAPQLGELRGARRSLRLKLESQTKAAMPLLREVRGGGAPEALAALRLTDEPQPGAAAAGAAGAAADGGGGDVAPHAARRCWAWACEVRETQLALARTEVSLVRMLCSGLPEILLQLLPEALAVAAELAAAPPYSEPDAAIATAAAAAATAAAAVVRATGVTGGVGGTPPSGEPEGAMLAAWLAPPHPLALLPPRPRRRLRAAAAALVGQAHSRRPVPLPAEVLWLEGGVAHFERSAADDAVEDALLLGGGAEPLTVQRGPFGMAAAGVGEERVEAAAGAGAAASAGGGSGSGAAAPRLACFDLLPLPAAEPCEQAWGAGVWPMQWLAATLQGEPCLVHVMQLPAAEAAGLAAAALGALQRQQAAGDAAACLLAPIACSWVEPAARGALRVCVQTARYAENLSRYTDSGARKAEGLPRHGESGAGKAEGRAPPLSAAQAPSLLRVAAELSGALCALHAVGLSCGGALRAEHVARLPDGSVRLCCLGTPPAPRAAATDGVAMMEVDGGGGSGSAGGEGCEGSPFEADVLALAALLRRLGAEGVGGRGSAALHALLHAGTAAPPPAAAELYLQLGLELSRLPEAETPPAVLGAPTPGGGLAAPPPLAAAAVEPPGGAAGTEPAEARQLHACLAECRRAAAPLGFATVVLRPHRLVEDLLAAVQALGGGGDGGEANGESAMDVGGGGGAAGGALALFRPLRVWLREAGAQGEQLRPLTVEQVLRAFWAALLRQGATGGDVEGEEGSGGPQNADGAGDGQADGGGAGMPLLELPPTCDPAASDASYVRPPADAPLWVRDTALAARGSAAAREAEVQLEGVGRLLLLSLAHGVPLPRWLPPHTPRLLLGAEEEPPLAPLAMAELQAALPRFAARSALLLSSVGTDLDLGELELGDFDLDELDDEIPEAGGGGAGRGGGKLGMVRAAAQWQLLGCRARATRALVRGFRQAQPAPLAACLVLLRGEVLALAGCANRPLPAAAVEAALCFEDWPEGSTTPTLLRAMIRHWSDLQRRRFLLLLCGRVTPPPPPPPGLAGGTQGRLVVRCWAESTQLPPRPLRAFWTLLLPDYQEPRLLIHMMGVLMQMRSS